MAYIKHLFHKYGELINYAFWGAFATVANVLAYFVAYDLMHLSNFISTLLAWIVAVMVAFVTNKLWVFKSRNTTWKQTVREFISFTGFRLISELFDLGIMLFAVDAMHWNALLWKVIANVIVITLNYFFSKFIIFRETPEQTVRT